MGCLNSKTDDDSLSPLQRSNYSSNERRGLVSAQPGVKGYGGNTESDVPPSKSKSNSSKLPLAASYPSTAPVDSPKAGVAKPLGQFKFLERSYVVSTPSSLVPQINELFKSICERYDISVTNREKIDEALQLFKQVLEVDEGASLEECFTKWRDLLTNPTFTVVCEEGSGNVKEIKVRADNIPKERRKAHKHIRDLLDACNLFLQQREFLYQKLVHDLEQLERLTGNLQALGKQANLNVFERKQLPKVVSSAQEQFAKFPEVMEMFWRQVHSLMHDINTAVHVLDSTSEPVPG